MPKAVGKKPARSPKKARLAKPHPKPKRKTPPKRKAAPKAVARKATPAVRPTKSGTSARHPAPKPKTAHAAKPKAPPKPPPVSPFSKAELTEVREKLMALLEQLQTNIRRDIRGASDRDLAHITDTSDMASDAAEGELAFRIAESEGVAAGEVQKAIDKVDNGSYGLCERCSKPIGAERMHFLPFATQCIRCQELAEIRKRQEEVDELSDLAEATEETHDEV